MMAGSLEEDGMEEGLIDGLEDRVGGGGAGRLGSDFFGTAFALARISVTLRTAESGLS